jgi:hypothetical protein
MPRLIGSLEQWAADNWSDYLEGYACWHLQNNISKTLKVIQGSYFGFQTTYSSEFIKES